jgi:hypothetical protein
MLAIDPPPEGDFAPEQLSESGHAYKLGASVRSSSRSHSEQDYNTERTLRFRRQSIFRLLTSNFRVLGGDAGDAHEIG